MKNPSIDLDEELHQFFEVPNFMFGKISHNGQILRVNSEWVKKLGFTEKQILNTYWHDLLHPDDLAHGLKAMQILELQSTNTVCECRMRCMDGTYTWFAWDFLRKGEKIYCIGKERKEKRYVTDGNYLAAIVNSSNDAIISTDINGTITSWNESAVNMFGYVSQEIIGKPIATIIPREKHDEEEMIVASILQEKSIKHYETVRMTKFGVRIPVSLSVSPVKSDNGTIIGKAKILRDISDKKINEEYFQKSEMKLRGFLKSNMLGIFLWAEDGSIPEANDQFLALIGYTRDDFNQGRVNWRRITPPEFAPQDEEAAEEIKLYGQSKSFKKEYIRKDGSRIPVLIGAATLNDGTNNGVCYVVDITELRNAEEKIQEKERSFKDLANSMPQIVWINDNNGKNEFLNNRYFEFTGINPEKVNDNQSGTIIHEDDREKTYKLYEESLIEKKPYDNQLRLWDYKKKDFRWFISRAVPAFDKNGKILKWYGTSTDIHEQKMLEIEQQKLISLVESTPDFILLFDQNHKIIYSNRFANEMLGLSTRTINLEQILTDPRLFQENISPGLLANGRWEGEVELLHAENGKRITTHTHSFLIQNQFKKDSITAFVSRDITEIKSSEMERLYLQNKEQAAQESSRLKSEFLANMSHEIRTPINGIIGMTTLMLTSNLDCKQSSMLNSIYHASNSLISIVEDILDFSKIEVGKLELDIIDFDLKNLISTVNDSFKHTLDGKGTKLIVDMDKNIQGTHRGDSNRLRQIFTNLLANGIKFSNGGDIFLTAKLLAQDSKHQQLRFEVRDHGIGISQEDLKKLFNPFTQADSATSRKYGGTGLGLSICKHLVELMHGKIGVQSALGKGSTFWFEIPLEMSKTKMTLNRTPFPTIELQSLKGIRVLVAEDNFINQKVIAMTLIQLEATVLVVDNGEDAINALKSQEFDIILMDIQMPVMDGYKATAEIRSGHAPYSTIPIIAVSANALSDEKNKCLALGMNDYITKPMNLPHLSETILKHVKNTPQVAAKTRIDLADPSGELYQELVELFKASTPESMKIIMESYLSNDFEKILFEVHKLKSASLNLGFQQIGILCKDIEELIHLKFYGKLLEKIIGLENEVKRLSAI